MGGHGGLNILPQKKWNVYNYDNRDIVQKDKKQHAEKMRIKYQSQRINRLQNKFEVLKGQQSSSSIIIQKITQSINKDSVLNNEFRRLNQQNKHVNLFQKEQRIIQNREILQYEKIKQTQYLKNKDNIDYSSKFLGTYNDGMPWYVNKKGEKMIKQYNNNNSFININKNKNRIKQQRYDMDDLTEKMRIQTIKNKQYYKGNITQIQKAYGKNNYTHIQQHKIQTQKQKQVKLQKQQQKQQIVRQKQQRQRSRNQKYEFIKNKIGKQQISAKFNQNNSIHQTKKVRQNIIAHNDKVKIQQGGQEQLNVNIGISSKNNSQIDELRVKRLKRQQKQRKRAQLLRQKMLQNQSR